MPIQKTIRTSKMFKSLKNQKKSNETYNKHEKMSSKDRLIHLNVTNLKQRQLHGDMTEVLKFLHNICEEVPPNFK